MNKNQLKDLKREELEDIIIEIYNLNETRSQSKIEYFLSTKNRAENEQYFIGQIDIIINNRYRINNQDSDFMAIELNRIRGELESSLLNSNTYLAWELIDMIVQNDGNLIDFFSDECTDLWEALENFNLLWLDVSSKLNKPQSYWVNLLKDIISNDSHGCRDNFIPNLNILLDEAGIAELTSSL